MAIATSTAKLRTTPAYCPLVLLITAVATGVVIDRCYPLAATIWWLAAATFTWWLNRTLTFKDEGTGMLRQWLMFLAANSGGGLINIGISSALIAARVTPVAAIACGALAGLMWNFLASRQFVFRRRASHGE